MERDPKLIAVEVSEEDLAQIHMFCHRYTFETFKELVPKRDDDLAYELRDAVVGTLQKILKEAEGTE